MEIREREKFMVCLHIFPAVYSRKSDSLPAWHTFVPATPLHLNYQNIPQRPTWIDDPKQYLNYVQLATKLHYLAPLIRISQLSANVSYHRYEAQCSLPARCCPQYIIPPADGSLIYRVRPSTPWAARRRGQRAAAWGGLGGEEPAPPGLPKAGAGESRPGGGQGAPARGGGSGLQTGHRTRNLNRTLTLSLSHSTIQYPLSADCLLLVLMLKATVTSIYLLFTFAF